MNKLLLIVSFLMILFMLTNGDCYSNCRAQWSGPGQFQWLQECMTECNVYGNGGTA